MTVYNDYPKAEIIVGAQEAVAQMRAEGHPDAHAYFKASCPKCGERCQFQEPDVIFEEMECAACGHTFPFTEGNYMLASRRLPA
jgi:hypothetical protein